MCEQNEELKAQGLFDAFQLLDKDLIEKIMKISKTIHVQTLDDGTIRVSVDLVPTKE